MVSAPLSQTVHLEMVSFSLGTTTKTGLLLPVNAPGTVYPAKMEPGSSTSSNLYVWHSHLFLSFWLLVFHISYTVFYLYLQDKNFLTGEFPPEVVLLKGNLERLTLSENLVFTRGDTFNSYMGELRQLTRLDYSDTNFINQNGIPTEIGLLKKLGAYKCNRIRYVGTISSLAFPSDMTQLCK